MDSPPGDGWADRDRWRSGDPASSDLRSAALALAVALITSGLKALARAVRGAG